jgi:F-type H+-transporting ATPase subunit epsilon
MNTFKLTIITPNKEVYSGNVISVNSKNSIGNFQVFANHAPFITTTLPAITTFKDVDGKIHDLFTSTGTMQYRNGQLLFCTDAAEESEDIDVERAEEAKQRAENRLADNKDIDVERAQMALLRAITRLEFSNKR